MGMRAIAALCICAVAALAALGAANAAQTCDPQNLGGWTLPAGFVVQPYHDGKVKFARSLAASGNSKLGGPVITYVSALGLFGGDTKNPQNITALVDVLGKGFADYAVTVVPGTLLGNSTMPNGIAWFKNTLWIAALQAGVWGRLYRIDNIDAIALANRAATPAEVVLVRDDLPFAFMHGWKFIRFDKVGNLYIPIGADDNIALMNGTGVDGGLDDKVSPHVANAYQKNASTPIYRFSSIYKFGPYPITAATKPEWIAFGVRNTVGFDFHPTTGDMYFTDNGRDNIGGSDTTLTSNAPDCELNYLGNTTGPFPAPRYFGYPYCHTGPAGNAQAQAAFLRPAGVGNDIVDPDTNLNESAVLCNTPGKTVHSKAIQAYGPHIAPLGMRFGKSVPNGNFPAEYSSPNNIYAAHHGSWNRPQGLIGARVMLSKIVPGTGSSKFVKLAKRKREYYQLEREDDSVYVNRQGRRQTTRKAMGGFVPYIRPQTTRPAAKTSTRPVLATVNPAIDTPFNIPVMDPSLLVNPQISSYSAFFAGGVPGDTGKLPDGPNPPVIGSGSLFNGRPVDMEWLPDGSMLVSDDQKGRVLRIAYCGTGGFPGAGGDDDGEEEDRRRRLGKRGTIRLGMNRCGGVLSHGRTSDALGRAQSSRSASLWSNGCRINVNGLTSGGPAVKTFKRCLEWDVTGLGNYVTLGFNLLRHPTNPAQVIMDAAMVTLDYAGTNGNGWFGFSTGLLSGASGSKVDGMVGLNAIIAKPAASAASGASVTDYLLGSSTCSRPVAACFTATKNYLYNGTAMTAGVAGSAIVQTFSVLVSTTNLKTINGFIGLGDVDATTGAMKQHWKLAKISFALSSSDVGAIGSATSTLINPGLSWAAANAGGATPAPYPSNPPCTLNGANYDSCTTLTDAGAPMTFYYSNNSTDSTTLRVAIRASIDALGGSSKGWIAWGFNPTAAGTMVGTTAVFARYDGSAASKATAVVFKMGGYAASGFSVPSPNPFSRISAWSDVTGGATYLNLQFSVAWSTNLTPGGFLINYASGAYNGGSATGADGMMQHAVVPPKACVRNASGMGPVSPCGGCA